MSLSFIDDSATITTTEYSLPRDANYASGTPVAVATIVEPIIDFTNIVAGSDEFKVRLYRHINGTQRMVFETLINQPIILWLGPIRCSSAGWDVTVVKVTGTDRSIAWSDGRDSSPATLDANVITWLGSAPNALISGRVDGTVGAMQNNVLVAAAINASAFTSGKFAAAAIDASAIAADAIGASELATDAVTEITDAILAKAYEGSTTIQAFLRLGGAVLFGKASGLEGATMTFRDFADTKDRVVASYAAGARTPTTRDAT